jgi:Ni,Fe-hydrogenase III large subunit/Ni,Fe-hydrogenase III component G
MSDGIPDIAFEALDGATGVRHAHVDARQWRALCEQVAASGGRLVALWGSDRTRTAGGLAAHAALATSSTQAECAVITLLCADAAYPDISDVFPAANRMQRAMRDLLGLVATGAADQRKWLRHVAWRRDEFPLRKSGAATASAVMDDAQLSVFKGKNLYGLEIADDYPFVQVSGDGVHEIPVGPVHAGTIEPGHFRFSVVGERVLRLEQRLGYKHKGIEQRFEQMDIMQGAKLAARVSGDSATAFGWAYAMAVESAAGVTPPPRALWLRALLLERERIANHLGDLGFLGNDAGLAFGLSQFLILKEDVLRLNHALFGHRYLMDIVVPGGVARDFPDDGVTRVRDECSRLKETVRRLQKVYDEHAGLQDRFVDCGRVTPDLAVRLGLIGQSARASGQSCDVRVTHPCTPYRELEVKIARHNAGDVAARVAVRFAEIVESIRLLRLIVDRLPLGEIAAPVPTPPAGKLGIGWVEGWRGDVFVALETGEDGRIARLHPRDPSWHNWPLLEHAILGNIVPDFPLINKSFNLSYAGQDL